MAFENIKDLTSIKVEANNQYFLDANVWVYAMNSVYNLHASDKGNPLYTKLFFNIIESELKPRPQIVLCSMLMSEIINTYLRKIALPDYLFTTYTSVGKKSPPNFDFKQDYRKTEHFRTNYRIILNDIKAYNASIKIVDDSFAECKPFQFGNNCPANMDFTDYYYFLLACKINKDQKKPFLFVTNDGDFGVTNFEIYTSSKALLDLKK